MNVSMIKRRELGVSAVVVILCLPVLLAGTAATLDAGNLLLMRYRLQAAADLAALAGVQSVDWDELALGQLVLDESEALQRARYHAEVNIESMMNRSPERVDVWVVNASEDDPAAHPLTGGVLVHPTVVVACEVRGPDSWFNSWQEAPVLRVEADGSLRTRRDD